MLFYFFTLRCLYHHLNRFNFITNKISICLRWIFASRTLLLWFTDICLKINVPVEWQGKEEQSKWSKVYKIKQWRRSLIIKKGIKMNCWGLWKGQTRPFCSLVEGRLLVLLQRSVWLPYDKQRRTKGQCENEKLRKKNMEVAEVTDCRTGVIQQVWMNERGKKQWQCSLCKMQLQRILIH